MMPWYITVLTSVGSSILTSLFVEAYQQRRATEKVYDHDV